MALTTNTDDRDDDSAEEHIFPPYQDRNTTFRVENSNSKRGQIGSSKQSKKLDQIQSFAPNESRNAKESPLNGAITAAKNFVASRKSQIISQSNTPSMARRITQYQQKLSNIELQRYTAKKGTPRAQLDNLAKNQSVFSQNQQHLNLPKPSSVHRISNASSVVKRGDENLHLPSINSQNYLEKKQPAGFHR